MICWLICIRCEAGDRYKVPGLARGVEVAEERTESVKGQMLPGVAGICMFMIFMTMVNVYAGLRGRMGRGAGSMRCWRFVR